MSYTKYKNENKHNIKNTRNITKKYFYVYRITNITTNRHYYGSRSSEILPCLDIGIRYFSSSYDNEFITEQKKYPLNFKYKVVIICKDNIDKQLAESYLHNKFDVAKNIMFYNMSKQTLYGFDSTGHHYNRGKKLSDETKLKLSKSLKGRYVSPETREKQRIHALNRTKEDNLYRGLKNKGKVPSAETRKIWSNQRSGSNNANSKTITILDSNDEIIKVCNGDFYNVCIENEYPWARLRKAKYGKKLYLDGNGKKSRNIPSKSLKFIGWSIKYE